MKIGTHVYIKKKDPIDATLLQDNDTIMQKPLQLKILKTIP